MGIVILLFAILAAALPVIVVFFWFRKKKPEITLPWFLISLIAGIISLFAAALIQSLLLSPVKDTQNGIGTVFFSIFVRIALVEELSRLLTLFLVLKTGRRSSSMNSSFAASLGLIAGLGFAMVESASYGTADINITLLRIFSAAPLHAACGIRAGTAIFIIPKQQLKAAFYFFAAVLIHGAYNLMIVSPALPSLLAIPFALAAFLSSLYLIKTTSGKNDNIL